MLAVVMLINRVGAMVLPFLGIYMTDSLGFTLSQTGIVLSCFGVGAMIGSALGGWLTDKKGHFNVQFVSFFLSVPVFFMLPQFTTPFALAMGVFTLSVITETFRPANSVSISSYAKPENLTRAFSLNRMALNLGFSIGPALGGILAAISYKFLFYGNGLTAAIAGLIFYNYFKNIQPNKNRKGSTFEGKIKKEKTGISPWKDGPFLIFSILCCLYSVCFFQFLSTLPIFYREIHKLSEANIGLLLAFNGMVVFLLEMLLVQIAERKSRPVNIISVGTLLLAISFLVLVLPGGQGILFFSMLLLSISEILCMPFMATVSVKRAGHGREGTYMGLNALAFSSAHVISPILGTNLAAHFGYNILWISIAVLGLITAVGFKWVFSKF
jgi:predicted MFS family arabinose efflux permease